MTVYTTTELNQFIKNLKTTCLPIIGYSCWFIRMITLNPSIVRTGSVDSVVKTILIIRHGGHRFSRRWC